MDNTVLQSARQTRTQQPFGATVNPSAAPPAGFNLNQRHNLGTVNSHRENNSTEGAERITSILLSTSRILEYDN